MQQKESLPIQLCGLREDSDITIRFSGLRQNKRSPEKKSKFLIFFSQKGLDKKKVLCYNNAAERYGPVAQLVRALACHARGRGFEPLPGRHYLSLSCAGVAQLAEQLICNQQVAGSSPFAGSIF